VVASRAIQSVPATVPKTPADVVAKVFAPPKADEVVAMPPAERLSVLPAFLVIAPRLMVEVPPLFE